MVAASDATVLASGVVAACVLSYGRESERKEGDPLSRCCVLYQVRISAQGHRIHSNTHRPLIIGISTSIKQHRHHFQAAFLSSDVQGLTAELHTGASQVTHRDTDDL